MWPEPAIEFDRSDVAIIIDALLQAEMTLPLLDERHQALPQVDQIRTHQLSLADRLEDMLAHARNGIRAVLHDDEASGQGSGIMAAQSGKPK